MDHQRASSSIIQRFRRARRRSVSLLAVMPRRRPAGRSLSRPAVFRPLQRVSLSRLRGQMPARDLPRRGFTSGGRPGSASSAARIAEAMLMRVFRSGEKFCRIPLHLVSVMVIIMIAHSPCRCDEVLISIFITGKARRRSRANSSACQTARQKRFHMYSPFHKSTL